MIRLRLLRLMHNLTQIDLAAKSGVSASKISLIERGHVQPSSRDVFHLAEALGVRPQSLLELVSERLRPSSRSINHDIGGNDE